MSTTKKLQWTRVYMKRDGAEKGRETSHKRKAASVGGGRPRIPGPAPGGPSVRGKSSFEEKKKRGKPLSSTSPIFREAFVLQKKKGGWKGKRYGRGGQSLPR